MRFLKGVVALLAVLYPAACYLLALSVGGLEKWVCIPPSAQQCGSRLLAVPALRGRVA